MMNMMKKTIDVSTKQIKTFFYDLTKVTESKIDDEVNKFLKKLDGEELDITVFPNDQFLIITVVYDDD